MNGPGEQDWCSEADALDDILEDGDDSMYDEGKPFFGLPPRPNLRDISADILKIQRLKLYEVAKAAKTGQSCKCPSCAKSFVKKSYQQAFCSNKGKNNCKDLYWNRASTQRSERAKIFSSR